MAKDDSPVDASASVASRDVALIHGVAKNGDLAIVRQRDNRIEIGAVRPLRDGVPIVGEVVRLTPRPEFPLLCDVKTELAAPPPALVAPGADVQRKGPAQVATDEYRSNWERIWSSSVPKGNASN